MVERLLCKQDVSGSSPLTSTKKKLQHQFLGKRMNAGCLNPVKNLENCIKLKIKSGRVI